MLYFGLFNDRMKLCYLIKEKRGGYESGFDVKITITSLQTISVTCSDLLEVNYG